MQKNNQYIIRIPVRDDRGNVVDEIEAVTFRGLLALAHEDGLRSVRTRLLQPANEQNKFCAVVHAEVRTRKGAFTGIGDAAPSNVNRRIAPHVTRMAETRAVARALRVAVNIGTVCADELAEDARSEEVVPVEGSRAASDITGPAHRGRDTQPQRAEPGDRRPMTEAQRSLLFRLAFQLGEGRDTATARVVRTLGVDRLEQATRALAARGIDALKSELEHARSERASLNGEATHA